MNFYIVGSEFSNDVMRVKRNSADLTWDVYYHKPVLVCYLFSWITSWPFYVVLLFLEDFIAEIVNWFADRIGNAFRRRRI